MKKLLALLALVGCSHGATTVLYDKGYKEEYSTGVSASYQEKENKTRIGLDVLYQEPKKLPKVKRDISILSVDESGTEHTLLATPYFERSFLSYSQFAELSLTAYVGAGYELSFVSEQKRYSIDEGAISSIGLSLDAKLVARATFSTVVAEILHLEYSLQIHSDFQPQHIIGIG